GSFGDPIKPVIDVDTDTAARSVVHDIAPTDIGSGVVGEDSLPSGVRDVNDVDLRTGLVAPVEGSPEAWAFQNAADASNASAATEGTMRSALRDIAPPDVSSSSTYSGDDLAGPGYLANPGADAIRAVRDVTDVDLRGTAATTNFTDDGTIPNVDSAEAYSPSFHSGGTSGDAFLSSAEASQYNAASADSSGLTTDEGQLYN